MSFWKKIKSKLKLGLGAVAVAVVGASSSYWAYEKIGYEKNVHVFAEKLDHVAYAGDGGIDTPQRAAVVQDLQAYAPVKFRELGDLCYDVGCGDEDAYQKHIAKPFGDLGEKHNETLLIGGNHQAYNLKAKERHYLQSKFQNGPVGKVRFDNYYGLHVYENACEVYFESTVYDVKLGDPKIQDRQEDFVCKAALDSRCKGKIMLALTHQAAVGKGPRGNTKSGDYKKFDKKCIQPNFDYVLSGHEHINLYSGQFGRAHYIISGTLAKLTYGSVGYLTLDNGFISYRKVNTAPTMSKEDEE